MKHFLLTFIAGWMVSTCFASFSPDQDSSYSDSVYVDDNVADTGIDENMDNLMKLWYTQKANAACDSAITAAVEADSSLSSIPDSVFIQRLARIPSVIPLTYNHVVRNLIEMYLYKKRDVLESVVGLINYYNPIIDEIFDEYDVPNELKYMAVIESALNPRACSRTRAVGLWQFMYGTGRLYGLTVNSLVDDRRDPIKATHAAVRFSKDLYAMFGDWQLVIAAYNCGPNNVKKAMRRSGGKQNFWDIYYYLPRETRGHVPAFIAAIYVVTYYREHGVVPKPITLPLTSDTITIHKKMHLAQISHVLNIPLTTLRDMNPQYICDIVPAFSDQPYSIRLPMEFTTKFIDLEDSIRRYRDTVYFNPKMDLKSPTRYYSAYTGNGKRIVYIVKQGDNLGAISMRFHVSINQIKDWNGFNSNVIRAGQRLVIYVPARYAASVAPAKSSGKPVVTSDGKNQYYTVREGDTIWEIARKFPGTTADDIIRLNNLGSADKITPGQRLIISAAK